MATVRVARSLVSGVCVFCCLAGSPFAQGVRETTGAVLLGVTVIHHRRAPVVITFESNVIDIPAR
jgi:hypothetical protein